MAEENEEPEDDVDEEEKEREEKEGEGEDDDENDDVGTTAALYGVVEEEESELEPLEFRVTTCAAAARMHAETESQGTKSNTLVGDLGMIDFFLVSLLSMRKKNDER